MNPELIAALRKTFEEDHFASVRKMVQLGSGAEREIDDFMLTRYACYLIAQNGDPRKEQIAFAQRSIYFANKNKLGNHQKGRWQVPF